MYLCGMDTDSILSRLGISELNEMQRSVSGVMTNESGDVVVLSPTGSGKTLAYLLPLTKMINPESDAVQVVVIVPGRELALQSYEVFASMKSGLRAMCLYGGRPAMDEHRLMRKTQPHVVFVTPGRLNDHLDKGNILADDVRYLIIDEFDKCLRMGFREEMSEISSKLYNVRRRILLSATDAEEIPRFVNMGKVRKLDFLDDNRISDRINQFVVKSPTKDKLETLALLLCGFGKESSIVFLNYRESVERVSSFLEEKGFIISSFHGGKSQDEREDAIYRFSNGSANVLVGTDLASRGLDIPEVENIVHYHLPVGKEEYIHRVGRTGRWKSYGRSFVLLGPEEFLPEYMDDVHEEYLLPADFSEPMKPQMVTLYIGKGKKDKISKGDVLGFLCKNGGLTSSDIGRIDVKERCSYVAVNREKHEGVINQVKGKKLKGIKTVVEIVKCT